MKLNKPTKATAGENEEQPEVLKAAVGNVEMV